VLLNVLLDGQGAALGARCKADAGRSITAVEAAQSGEVDRWGSGV